MTKTLNDIGLNGDSAYGVISAIELKAQPKPDKRLYIELSGMGGNVGVYLSLDKVRFLRDYLSKYLEQEQR